MAHPVVGEPHVAHHINVFLKFDVGVSEVLSVWWTIVSPLSMSSGSHDFAKITKEIPCAAEEPIYLFI